MALLTERVWVCLSGGRLQAWDCYCRCCYCRRRCWSETVPRGVVSKQMDQPCDPLTPFCLVDHACGDETSANCPKIAAIFGRSPLAKLRRARCREPFCRDRTGSPLGVVRLYPSFIRAHCSPLLQFCAVAAAVAMSSDHPVERHPRLGEHCSCCNDGSWYGSKRIIP